MPIETNNLKLLESERIKTDAEDGGGKYSGREIVDGQSNNLFNDILMFPKPKGMRWATFDRKRAELSAMEVAYWQAFSPVVDRITGVIERKAGKAARAIGLEL
jgi:hypothetical protein